MTRRKLGEFRALSFDCYGTLIDWETGIWDALQPLLAGAGRSDVTRAVALEAYGRIEHEQESLDPGAIYSEILKRVHAAIGRRFGIATTPELDAAFAASLPHWPAFPDTADALRFLKTRYKLVILSNVHREGIAASRRKLGVDLDGIYTAQDIGAYKPSLRNFEYLLDRLRSDHGVARSEVLHTAQSLFHDHVPAKACGLATAWIDRQRLSQGGSWGATAPVPERPEVDFVFFSLGEMAEAVGAAFETLAE